MSEKATKPKKRTTAGRRFLTAAAMAAALYAAHKTGALGKVILAADRKLQSARGIDPDATEPSADGSMAGGCKKCMSGMGSLAVQYYIPKEMQSKPEFRARVRAIKAQLAKSGKSIKDRAQAIGRKILEVASNKKVIRGVAALTALAVVLAAAELNPQVVDKIKKQITPRRVKQHSHELDELEQFMARPMEHVQEGDDSAMEMREFQHRRLTPDDDDGMEEDLEAAYGTKLALPKEMMAKRGGGIGKMKKRAAKVRSKLPTKSTLVSWGRKIGVPLAAVAAAVILLYAGHKNQDAIKQLVSGLGPRVQQKAVEMAQSQSVPQQVVEQVEMMLPDQTAAVEEETYQPPEIPEFATQWDRPVPAKPDWWPDSIPYMEGKGAKQHGGSWKSLKKKLPSKATLIKWAKAASITLAAAAAVVATVYAGKKNPEAAKKILGSVGVVAGKQAIDMISKGSVPKKAKAFVEQELQEYVGPAQPRPARPNVSVRGRLEAHDGEAPDRPERVPEHHVYHFETGTWRPPATKPADDQGGEGLRDMLPSRQRLVAVAKRAGITAAAILAVALAAHGLRNKDELQARYGPRLINSALQMKENIAEIPEKALQLAFALHLAVTNRRKDEQTQYNDYQREFIRGRRNFAGDGLTDRLPSRQQVVSAAKKAAVGAAAVVALVLAAYGLQHKDEILETYGPRLTNAAIKMQTNLSDISDKAVRVANELNVSAVPYRARAALLARRAGLHSVGSLVRPSQAAIYEFRRRAAEKTQTGGALFKKLPSKRKLISAAKRFGVTVAALLAVGLLAYGVKNRDVLQEKYGDQLVDAAEAITRKAQPISDKVAAAASDVWVGLVPVRRSLAKAARDIGATTLAANIKPSASESATYFGRQIKAAVSDVLGDE